MRKPIVLVIAAVVLVGAIVVGLGTLVGRARQTRMAALNRAEGNDDERGTERRWARRDLEPAPSEVAAPSETAPAPAEAAPPAEDTEATPPPQAAQPAASAARPVLQPPIRRKQPPLSPAERAMTQTETVLSSVRGSGPVEMEEGAAVREDKRALEALPGSLSSALRDSITFSKVECYERGCVMQIGYPNMEAYRRANADFFTDTRSEFNSWRGLRQRTPPIVGPDGKVQSSWILLREE